MSYGTSNANNFVNGVTTVDCHKQVRSWRLLRSIFKLLIPTCNCNYIEEEEEDQKNYLQSSYYSKPIFISNTATIITGTIFGYRRGKVSFCIQSNSKSINPILLLELAVPTALIAKEMQSGLLRIALECSSDTGNITERSALLSVPVWTMYCNGSKAGFAFKRRPTMADMEVLRVMQSVCVGAGVISEKELNCDDELMYLRANFKRVRGSSDSESFHLINPDGNTGQELSFFFLRS